MDIMSIFVILMVVIAIQSILLILIMWKTPAFTFLKASLTKMNVLYVIGKDRLGFFKAFKAKNGAAILGKDGIFALTDNSSTLESGSKIPIYFAFRDLAATLFPEYPAIIQELREKGLVINNIEDVNGYIKKIKQGLVQDLPVTIHAYKTYKFHELENMFPNNLDPSFIDATVQCEISRGLKLMKMTPALVGGGIMILMVAAVAIFIINKAFSGNITVEDCQALVSSGQIAVNAASTAAGGGPLIP
jgi:hypothetical protein